MSDSFEPLRTRLANAKDLMEKLKLYRILKQKEFEKKSRDRDNEQWEKDFTKGILDSLAAVDRSVSEINPPVQDAWKKLRLRAIAEEIFSLRRRPQHWVDEEERKILDQLRAEHMTLSMELDIKDEKIVSSDGEFELTLEVEPPLRDLLELAFEDEEADVNLPHDLGSDGGPAV